MMVQENPLVDPLKLGKHDAFRKLTLKNVIKIVNFGILWSIKEALLNTVFKDHLKLYSLLTIIRQFRKFSNTMLSKKSSLKVFLCGF